MKPLATLTIQKMREYKKSCSTDKSTDQTHAYMHTPGKSKDRNEH